MNAIKAKVLWTLDHLTIEEMIESGWLVVSDDIDIEQCTYPELVSFVNIGLIIFK